MTAGLPSRRLVFSGLALLSTLNACSGTPSPRLFTLAPRSSAAVGRFAGTISVRRVDLAKYLDRPQIVSYSDSYELNLSEFNRWGEGLADMITRVLIEGLAQALPGSQVYSTLGALTLPTTADVTLEVNIDRFELDPGGAVVLAAQWVAHRKGQRDQLRSAQISVTPSSRDIKAQVAAMSDALGQLTNQIATGLVG